MRKRSDEVCVDNPLIHAMREFQRAMEGEAERAGLHSDDDVVALVKEIRREIREELSRDFRESVQSWRPSTTSGE